MKKYLILFLITFLASCGKKSGNGTSPAGSKDLFSFWENTQNKGILTLDFRNNNFDQYFTFRIQSGEKYCDFNVLIHGTQSNGIIYMNYTGGHDCNIGDVGVFNENYTKSNDTLTICDTDNPSDCAVYK